MKIVAYIAAPSIYLLLLMLQQRQEEQPMQPKKIKGNRIELLENHALIYDHKGRSIAVDFVDLPFLKQTTWVVWQGKYGPYARNSKGQLMHRLLLQVESEQLVDHQDGNGLNNRRYNIRIASPVENSRNSKMPVTNTTGYKGVSKIAHYDGWQARIGVHKKTIHLGCFPSPQQAAIAYNDAAKERFGEFAHLNDLSGIDVEAIRSEMKPYGMRRTNTSGYTGVLKSKNRFQATVKINGKRKHLGFFDLAEDAADRIKDFQEGKLT